MVKVGKIASCGDRGQNPIAVKVLLRYWQKGLAFCSLVQLLWPLGEYGCKQGWSVKEEILWHQTVAAVWQTITVKWMKISVRMTLQRTSPISWIRWTRVKKWGTLLDLHPHQTNTENYPPGTPPLTTSCVCVFAGGPNLPWCVSEHGAGVGCRMGGWSQRCVWPPTDAPVKRLVKTLCNHPKLLWFLLFCTNQISTYNVETEISCILMHEALGQLVGKNIVSPINGDRIKPSLDIIPFLHFFRNFHLSSFPLSSSWPLFLPIFLSVLFFSCQCCNLPVPITSLSPSSSPC